MPATRPPYPPEFREEAVRLVREHGKKISEVARELGVSGESLRNWVKQAEIEEGVRKGLTLSEREALRRLRRENKILQQEREILKKPLPSSPGRPSGEPRTGAPIRGRREGALPHPDALPRGGCLPKRLLRLAAEDSLAAPTHR